VLGYGQQRSTGWIFWKEPYLCGAHLQKRPGIWGSLIINTAPDGAATMNRLPKLIGLFKTEPILKCSQSPIIQGLFRKRDPALKGIYPLLPPHMRRQRWLGRLPKVWEVALVVTWRSWRDIRLYVTLDSIKDSGESSNVQGLKTLLVSQLLWGHVTWLYVTLDRLLTWRLRLLTAFLTEELWITMEIQFCS